MVAASKAWIIVLLRRNLRRVIGRFHREGIPRSTVIAHLLPSIDVVQLTVQHELAGNGRRIVAFGIAVGSEAAMAFFKLKRHL